MSRLAPLLLLALAAFACAGGREPETRIPVGSRSGPTVVGRVTPEGVVTADTMSAAIPDTARVERETVVTGAIVQEPTAVVEPDVREGPWQVQVFAARDEPSARRVARQVEDAAGTSARIVSEGGWYKVRVGGFADRSGAEGLRARLIQSGYEQAFIVYPSGS